MGEYEELRTALRWLLLSQLAPMPRYMRGRLGDGQGRVQVPGRQDYSFVRPSRSTDDYIEVFNKEVSGGDGTPVLVGELPWQPGLTQIVSVDWQTYIQVGWGDGYAGVALHGATHIWQDGFVGTDTFNIFRRQIAPMRTYPAGSGSSSVYMSPYDYFYGGLPVSWCGLPGLDLSAATPATGQARLMLTYLDMANNVIGVITGTIGVYSDAIELPRPTLPTGTWAPSAYVRLFGGQPGVSESRDIRDARQLWNSASATPSGPAGGDLTGTYPNPQVVGIHGDPIDFSVAPAEDDALIFSASGTNYWRPLSVVPRSLWLQNGFPDASEVSIAWDDASRTLTVDAVEDSFRYLHAGTLYVKTAAQTEQIDDNEGLWVFYFDGATLTSAEDPSHDAIDDVIENHTVVAYVYWDATNNDGRLLYELHGAIMSPETHHWLHDNIGAVYRSGMALADFVIDDSGDDDEDAQFSIATGEFYDEDLEFETVSASGTVGTEIWYLDGADWRWTTNAGFSILTAGSGRMAFNDAGAQTEVSNNNFALCHIFATNIGDDSGANQRCIAIQGQAEYNTRSAARAGADTEINALVYGSLPLQEIVPVGTVIFQTSNNYGNAVKSRTISTSGGDDYVDWRGSDLKATGGSVADHGALAGLADDDHPQYLLVDGTRAMTGELDASLGIHVLSNQYIYLDTDKDTGIRSPLDDLISFYSRGAAIVNIYTGTFYPNVASVVDLGVDSSPWKDLFMTGELFLDTDQDSGIHSLGDGQIDFDIEGSDLITFDSEGIKAVTRVMDALWFHYPLTSGLVAGQQFRDNDASYPAGWTEDDAAQTSDTDEIYGMWYLRGTQANTSWQYSKAIGWDLENDAGANAYSSFQYGPILWRDGDFTDDLDYTAGVYGSTGGVMDINTYNRVRLHWDSGTTTWQIRGETRAGATDSQTATAYKDFGFPLHQPIFVRMVIRNNAGTKTCRNYIGTSYLAKTQTLMSNLSEDTTWGDLYYMMELDRGNGVEDYFFVGNVDTSSEP